MNYYRCEYFDIEELVDKATFTKWGEQAWMFFRPEALASLDQIRKFYNRPVTVNNWKWGGSFQYRGFRPRSVMVGAEYGQHRFGNAFDLDVNGVLAETVRRDIIANKDEIFTHITCLEAKVSWVHFDCRNVPNRIMLVYQY